MELIKFGDGKVSVRSGEMGAYKLIGLQKDLSSRPVGSIIRDQDNPNVHP